MLSAVVYLRHWNVRPSSAHEMSRHVHKFYAGMIKINEYLFNLNNECRRGQFDVAQNTFLDLQQHWQRQDVQVQLLQNQALAKTYLPSDSLRKLDKYLDSLYTAPDQEHGVKQIVKEIKRIHGKIDLMHYQ